MTDYPGPNESQPNPVNPQPGIAADRPNATPWIVFSVIELLCCNLLFGILGLVFSLQGKSAADQGNIAQAQSKLKLAKIMLAIGIALTLVATAIAAIAGVFSPDQLDDTITTITTAQ